MSNPISNLHLFHTKNIILITKQIEVLEVLRVESYLCIILTLVPFYVFYKRLSLLANNFIFLFNYKISTSVYIKI